MLSSHKDLTSTYGVPGTLLDAGAGYSGEPGNKVPTSGCLHASGMWP